MTKDRWQENYRAWKERPKRERNKCVKCGGTITGAATYCRLCNPAKVGRKKLWTPKTF